MKYEAEFDIWNLRFEYYLLIAYFRRRRIRLRRRLLVITFGDRLTVGQQVLDLFIGVRVPVPEPCRSRIKNRSRFEGDFLV